MMVSGIIVGLVSFLIIGFLHPVVIKMEYYWGKRSWPILAVSGIMSTVASLLSNDLVISIVLGVLAFSLFWSVKELFEQEERVRKGWYPSNPRKKDC